jgi:hypothetical protein
VWHDKETKEGGGVIQFVERHFKLGRESAVQWLVMHKDQLLGPDYEPDDEVSPADDASGKANGSGTQRKFTFEGATERYAYHDADGNHVFTVCRYEDPKDFRPWRQTSSGNWVLGLGDVDLVPYRLPELIEGVASGRTVHVVEGEKDVAAAEKLGLVATCNQGGTGQGWKEEYNEWFRGADVVVHTDNDDAGRKHQANVADALRGVAKRVRKFDLARHWRDIPAKGDLTKWVAQGGTREQLDRLVEVDKDPAAIAPEPYVCQDPTTLPLRDWLYGYFLIRKFVSVDVAPGGIGKSAQSLVEACAMASGKNLLGVAVKHRLRVWYWNLEDPADEIARRVEAIRIHYELKPEDLDGHLFVNHGRSTPLVIGAADKNGARIFTPIVNSLIAAIREAHVDVVVVDPFVSSHRVPENDNTAMDMIAKEWSRVAEDSDCAVRLTHHTRKGDQEVTSESGRGASAPTYAARVFRVFNRMTRQEADDAGVEGENRRRYYRTYIDKQNMTPPAEISDWFYLDSVYLNNSPRRHVNPTDRGDSVGVVTRWQWPEDRARVTPADREACLTAIKSGRYRYDQRAAMWVGNVIGRVLTLDLKRGTDKALVKAIIKKWIDQGALRVVPGMDEHREEREYVEVAE